MVPACKGRNLRHCETDWHATAEIAAPDVGRATVRDELGIYLAALAQMRPDRGVGSGVGWLSFLSPRCECRETRFQFQRFAHPVELAVLPPCPASSKMAAAKSDSMPKARPSEYT